MLRKNQFKAIQNSLENDFDSGVHFHATGTGKSWIALELILEYNKKYNNRNILWLCEQKSILIEQFELETLREKGYDSIFKTFMVIDYTENKSQSWYEEINSASFWNKPILLIINRSFLVSKKKYEKLKININLVIHDECHSIQNKTTQEFYNYLFENDKKVKCIGFSATPCLDIYPYNKILTSYTIYDAYLDEVIVPPRIKWIETNKTTDDNDLFSFCSKEIDKLYYKKIIVWCGIVEKCESLAEMWKKKYESFVVCLDTSKSTDDNYDQYMNANNNAILFCARKHREGSDIKNLDCCIFLDKVEKRNSKTFVQCIGRVLRKDKENKKEYGLILDLKASSCIKICDRLNEYLNCNNGFPWKYNYCNISINNKPMVKHDLLLRNTSVKLLKTSEIKMNSDELTKLFIKECPDGDVYKDRLNKELKMINDKNLSRYILRAVEILKLVDYIPHVTRGSCGSSLVCYLLGISNVDPIKYNISFARFLNEYRENLPDIDFDFPHYLRDEVFLKIELEWPNQVARISNHVHWHEKSALREGLRKIGINKQIPKDEINDYVKKLPSNDRNKVIEHQKELDNTFRHYSLHCGGIVFFHEGIPEELIINKGTLSQIHFDKRDVSKTSNFKIDILSSRGISQLMQISGENIDFNECPYDEETYNMLGSGDNIGVTLAESPLMRKALIKIKPKSIHDLAICLAIIRPAAKDARIENNVIDYDSKFIFDDDAISLLSNYLNIDEDLADKFRRNIAKGSWEDDMKNTYDELLSKITFKKQYELDFILKNLRSYSFCKSHSYSYAQLVYKIAYQKAHNRKAFWLSTLKNTHSSYRKWVHLYEAFRHGVDVNTYLNESRECSIYAEIRRKKFDNLSLEDQLRNFGYWNMKPGIFFPNCYFYKKDDEYLFGGIIASTRVIGYKPKTIVCYIGVSMGKYIEIVVRGKYFNPKHIGVKGRGTLLDRNEQCYEAHIAKFY
jgi:hypothetical protein